MRARGMGAIAACLLVSACKLFGDEGDDDVGMDASSPPRDAGPPTPLDRLRASSSVAVHARVASDGRILDVEGSFETTGATPEERAIAFLSAHPDAFGLTNPANQLEVIGSHTDASGSIVVTEGRVNLQIPVLFGEIRVSLDPSGRVTFVANELPPDFRVRDDAPTVRPVTATMAAETLTGLPVDPDWTPRVVVFNGGMLLETEGTSTLGYVVRVGSGVTARDVVIDGSRGDLLMSWPVAPSADARQTYVGEPDAAPVLVVWQEGTETRMVCPPQVGCPGPADTPVPAYCAAGVCPQPIDAPPPAIRRADLERALELHGHVGTVCTFLGTAFGRNGVADSTPLTRAYLVNGASNAFSVGQDDRGQPGIVVQSGFVELDVVAHEVGHEVHRVETSEIRSDLPVSIYPGAVAESMADILASLVDTTSPAVLGDGLGVRTAEHPCEDIRDLDNPARCGGPAQWRELRRPAAAGPCRDASPSCDEGYGCADGVSCYRDDGEVHHNSQILTRAFRLLVRQPPELPTSVPVRILGVEKMRAIWYRLLTRYLGPATGFYGVRSYARRACRELVDLRRDGLEIRDCGALLNAFAAVGIGDPDTDEDSWSDVVDDCPRLYDPAQDGDCERPDGGIELRDMFVPPIPDGAAPDLTSPDLGRPPTGGVHSCRLRTGEVCTNLTGAGYRVDRVAASEGCDMDTSEYIESPCTAAGSIGACTSWVGQLSELQEVLYAPAFDPAEEEAACLALPPPIGPGRWDSPYVPPL